MTKATHATRASIFLFLVGLYLLAFSILCSLLKPEPSLYWHGQPWFAHTDHWHVFLQVDSFFSSLFTPQSSLTVFSRLPSLFPDILSAAFIQNLFHPVLSLKSLRSLLVLNILLIFTSITIFSYILTRKWSNSLAVTLISLFLLYKLLPSSLYIYIPIHHGGNVINTLIAFSLFSSLTLALICARRASGAITFGLLIPFLLIGAISNRLFLFSAVLPILVHLCWLSNTEVPIFRQWRTSFILVCTLVLCLTLITHLPLTQGRDELLITPTTILPQLSHILLHNEVLSILAILVLANFFLYFCSNSLMTHLTTSKNYLMSQTFKLINLSSLFTVSASFVISIANDNYDITRYLFAPLALEGVLFSILLFQIITIVFDSKAPFLHICLTTLIIVLLSSSCQPINSPLFSAELLSNEIEILETIKNDPPVNSFGLATSPPWHATALSAISGSLFTIREASTDGNPLFWHLWKGAYVNSTGYSRLATGQNLTSADILPFSFVLTGPEESTSIQSFFGKPDRSLYCKSQGYHCLHYYNNSVTIRENTATFINTYGSRPKT